MKQWDIFDFPFPHPIGLHPAVVLSPDEIAGNSDIGAVNVLIVTSVRADYRIGRLDVMLNGADGLDHLSRVRLAPIFQADRSDFGRRRGSLSAARQKVVQLKLREIFRLG